ncbi:unnamed protein product [Peniophora sp. CBMAI 1063]|nr:unnamed protein product [Peniophora sp. CBMAI 1063]
MASTRHARSDSQDSGPGLVRAASHETDPFVARSTSVSSATPQAGRWSHSPTIIPIPGQKTRAQRRKKDRKRKAKKESQKMQTIKEEDVKPDVKPDKNGFVRLNKGEPGWEMDHEPRPGYVRVAPVSDPEDELKVELADGSFDWDDINDNPEIELFLIRMPRTIHRDWIPKLRIKDLAQTSPTENYEAFRSTKYVYTASVADLSRPKEDLVRDPNVQGLEMLDMEVLLPRRSEGGKLYMAPRGVQRTLTLKANPRFDRPSTLPESDTDTESQLDDEPRRYPDEMFRSRFLPIGSESVPPLRAPERVQPQAASSRELRPRTRKDAGEAPENAVAVSTASGTTVKGKRAREDTESAPKDAKEPPAKKRKSVRFQNAASK